MAGLEIQVDAARAAAMLEGVGRRVSPTTFLKLIGQRHLAWINENLQAEGLETRWAPMSPNTRAGRNALFAVGDTRKGTKRLGSPRLGQDTGQMRQRFTSELRGDAVAVGSPLQTAEWFHAGTRPHVIRPIHGPRAAPTRTRSVTRRSGEPVATLAFVTASSGLLFRRIVHHPGTPARPLLPSARLAAALATETLDAAVAALIKRVEGAGE